jgi:hypothetical protein
VCRDLPNGILHTLILGPVKYAVGLTKKVLSASVLIDLQAFMEAAPQQLLLSRNGWMQHT